MTPRIVIDALNLSAPLSRQTGEGQGEGFPPVTLRRWLALEAAGMDVWDFVLTGKAAAEHLAALSKILSANPKSEAESDETQSSAIQNPQSLRAHLAAPWRAFGEVHFKDPDRGTSWLRVQEEDGIGWMLREIEEACAAYRQCPDAVMDWPLSVLFALRTARKLREGAEWNGPSFQDEDRITRKAQQDTAAAAASAPATSTEVQQ
jgi:hypothetical protein